MNIYILTARYPKGTAFYDGIVVCAESEEDAMLIPPEEYMEYMEPGFWWQGSGVDILRIGIADENIPRGLVLASLITE